MEQQQFRIECDWQPAEECMRVSLNGKFGEESLQALEQSLRSAQQSHARVLVDLSEVTLVDRKTVQFLSDQASAHVRLVNCPSYLKRWIAQVSDERQS